MSEVKSELFRCSYCGHQYEKPQDLYCSNCIGSEYLKEEDLHMLYLQPVNSNQQPPKLTVPSSLVKKHNEAQKIKLHRILTTNNVKYLNSIAQDLKDAELKLVAYTLLAEWEIDLWNVIYYKNERKFCFGWKDGITQKEADIIEVKLEASGFKERYHYYFKIKNS